MAPQKNLMGISVQLMQTPNRFGIELTMNQPLTPRERTIASVEALARMFGASRAQVISYDRRPSIMRVRRAVAFILRLEGWTFQRIGRAIGREWSTVRDMLRPRVRAAA